MSSHEPDILDTEDIYRSRQCKECRGLGRAGWRVVSGWPGRLTKAAPVPRAFTKTCGECNGAGRVPNEPEGV